MDYQDRQPVLTTALMLSFSLRLMGSYNPPRVAIHLLVCLYDYCTWVLFVCCHMRWLHFDNFIHNILLCFMHALVVRWCKYNKDDDSRIWGDEKLVAAIWFVPGEMINCVRYFRDGQEHYYLCSLFQQSKTPRCLCKQWYHRNQRAPKGSSQRIIVSQRIYDYASAIWYESSHKRSSKILYSTIHPY